jgi:hypothetical protein
MEQHENGYSLKKLRRCSLQSEERQDARANSHPQSHPQDLLRLSVSMAEKHLEHNFGVSKRAHPGAAEHLSRKDCV